MNSINSSTYLILRSAAKRRVSKDGQQARCAFPPFETHRCAMLLRVRLSGLFMAPCFSCIHFESDSEEDGAVEQ